MLIDEIPDQLSMVFRGPISIKQIAVYTEDTTHTKRTLRPDAHHGHHGHQRFHQHKRETRAKEDLEAKRAIGDEVVATIDGKVVSWKNEYAGGASSPTPAPAAPAPAPPAPKAAEAPAASNQASNAPSVAPSNAPTVAAGTGNFARQAYYNSKSATAQGLTFLANNLWAENSAGYADSRCRSLNSLLISK